MFFRAPGWILALHRGHLPFGDPSALNLRSDDRFTSGVTLMTASVNPRPAFGTLPNIGAASVPESTASLIVLASPVWDYFASGMKPLRIFIEEEKTRTASHLGMVKTGGNYAAAMGPTLAARKQYNADQVLFC